MSVTVLYAHRLYCTCIHSGFGFCLKVWWVNAIEYSIDTTNKCLTTSKVNGSQNIRVDVTYDTVSLYIIIRGSYKPSDRREEGSPQETCVEQENRVLIQQRKIINYSSLHFGSHKSEATLTTNKHKH